MAIVFGTIGQNLRTIGVCLFALLAFSMWGHVMICPIYYKQGRWLEGFVWGTISGIASGAFVTSVVVYQIGWDLVLLVGCVVLLPSGIFLFIWKKMATRRSPRGLDLDLSVLFAALSLVTLFFYFPFKNLGALVGGNYVYAWLFGHDFINRMVHVTSLSQGLPLDGFFFAGETLSYYWLAYVYPAAIHRFGGIGLEIKHILQITLLFYSLFTAAALVILLREFLCSRRALPILLFLALCCYSYVGLFTIALRGYGWFSGENSIRILGYDLSNFSGFSHSLYRFFLVEPQGTLAISVMLMIFSLYENHRTVYGFGLIGLLLGLLLGIEATNGIMLLLWFVACGILLLFLNQGQRWPWIRRLSVSLAVALPVYAALFWIRMFSLKTGAGGLFLKPNWFAIQSSPAYLLLMFGPISYLGTAGMISLFKRERLSHWGCRFVLLLGLALFFGLFIGHSTEPHFGLFKASRIIPISFLMLTAYRWQVVPRNPLKKRFLWGLILLALPSLMMDNRVASDISSPSTYVREKDKEAAEWMKKNLPEGAIVQSEPNYPGTDGPFPPKFTYSFVPVFAERRTAIGEWKVSSQEHGRSAEVAERFHSVRKMYTTLDIQECQRILDRLKVEYIYVGELEGRLYPKGIRKFRNHGQLFEVVFQNKTVQIFHYHGCAKEKNGGLSDFDRDSRL